MKDVILKAVVDELNRQAQASVHFSPWVDADDASDAVIDGHVDLRKVADAIVQAISRPDSPETPAPSVEAPAQAGASREP
jgi:hypothetical protein